MERKMSEDARNARNAYYRAWRAKNPDKVRSSNERYWSKKAAEMTATDKEAENDAAEEYANSEGNCAAVKR